MAKQPRKRKYRAPPTHVFNHEAPQVFPMGGWWVDNHVRFYARERGIDVVITHNSEGDIDATIPWHMVIDAVETYKKIGRVKK